MIQLHRDSIPNDVLEEIITLGEGYKTEFKETLPALLSIAKSLCAFANTKGGNLFVGINDSGKPIGIFNENDEIAKLEEALPLVLPKPEITASVVRFKKNGLIFIRIMEGNKKPYYVKNGKNTRAYIRVGAVNLPASKKILKQFIESKKFSKKKTKGFGNEEKVIFDLFSQHQRLSIAQIKAALNYSERRIKKTVATLAKYGFVVPSENEKNTFYKSKEPDKS